ncbi:hypothetical protein CQW23_29709 [Capsicum baccatum]|uniref:F-box associated beta-propeller type 3 domain-containing protein n=1 Tax=Capsicum baccatum TaxID=33114 RepID=A0A2G2VCK3_CAPBA|nr:hypothetical protein CQW23_29709 [Capsicum baccatum]
MAGSRVLKSSKKAKGTDNVDVDEILNYGSDEPSEILALRSGSWRKIVEHPRVTDNMLLDMHSLTCIHGEFHWVGFSRNYFVVSFDISHEVYGEIPLPECLSNIGDIGISELEGMLCAYSNVYHHGRHTIKVWVMKDCGLKESLNALFSIENPNVIMPIPKYRFANGEVLFWCVYTQVPENAYWTQRGRFALFPRGLRQNGFTYTESLISPGLLT